MKSHNLPKIFHEWFLAKFYLPSMKFVSVFLSILSSKSKNSPLCSSHSTQCLFPSQIPNSPIFLPQNSLKELKDSAQVFTATNHFLIPISVLVLFSVAVIKFHDMRNVIEKGFIQVTILFQSITEERYQGDKKIFQYDFLLFFDTLIYTYNVL